MQAFRFEDAPFHIREDIAPAYREYWRKLAAAGSWWTGAERVAIAAESRNALLCPFCRDRKQALSPYTMEGRHTHEDGLSEIAVDAVHRIVTDQGRITRSWVEENATRGLPKEAYVELVGVVVTVFSIDEFHRALGLAVEPLPQPQPGEVSRYRPPKLSEDIGFVPTVPPEGGVGDEADLWPGGRAANVIRALTLVPQALRDWRSVADVQYMPLASMTNFVQIESRAIDRMQMELIAGRVSAINECFY